MAKEGGVRTTEPQKQSQATRVSPSETHQLNAPDSYADFLELQGAIGNRTMGQLMHSRVENSSSTGILQRKCSCGNTARVAGACAECQSKREGILQTKLQISEPGDRYEQEADQVADQVLADPAHPVVGATPSSLQRFTKAPGRDTEVVPASVYRVLASPGSPLEPELRQDMEQRFGYSFSQVRVHTDGAAAKSARDVNANAYTVGDNIVFGTDQYTPSLAEGRKLLAHELVHVIQQSGDPKNHHGILQRQTSSPQRPPHRRPSRVRASDSVEQAAHQSFTQFEARDSEAARLIDELERLFSLLAVRLEDLIDEYAVRNSDAVDIYERWLSSASRRREQMVSGEPPFSPRRIFLWVTAIRNALNGQHRIVRALREEVPDDQAFQEVVQLRTQAANLVSEALVLPIVQEGRAEVTQPREAEETSVEENIRDERIRAATEDVWRYARRLMLRGESIDFISQHIHARAIRYTLVLEHRLSAEEIREVFETIRDNERETFEFLLFRNETIRELHSYVNLESFRVDVESTVLREGNIGLTVAEGLAGEFAPLIFGDEEDVSSFESTYGAIAVDTTLGFVPILDQALDTRDMVGHFTILYTNEQERTDPTALLWRSVGIAFSLIGIIPEVGTAIKGISRVIIRPVRRHGMQVVSFIADIAERIIRRIAPWSIDTILGLRRTLVQHWTTWAEIGQQRLSRSLNRLMEIAQTISSAIADRFRQIKEAVQRVIPGAFIRARDIFVDLFNALARKLGGVADVARAAFSTIRTRIARFSERATLLIQGLTPTGRLLREAERLDLIDQLEQLRTLEQRVTRAIDAGDESAEDLQQLQEQLDGLESRLSSIESALETEHQVQERAQSLLGDRQLLPSDVAQAEIPTSATRAGRRVTDEVLPDEDVGRRASSEVADDSDSLSRSATRATETPEQAGERVGQEVMEEADERAFRETGDAEPHRTVRDEALKQEQLLEALAAAQFIEETNDVADSPLAFTLFQLTALKRRYRWIERFEARTAGSGTFNIYMIATEHFVARNTPGNAELIEAVEQQGIGREILEDFLNNPQAQRASVEAVEQQEIGREILEDFLNNPQAQRASVEAAETQSRNSFANATKEEFDAALEEMVTPQVTGGQTPRIEGHRVPTSQRRRYDIEDVLRRPGETARDAVRRVRRAVGHRLSDHPAVSAAWERARTHVLRDRTLTASNYEELYNLTRNRFWQEVRNDPDAQSFFINAGFEFPSGRTTAPTLSGVGSGISRTEIRISLDHIREKAIGENWRYALDADNLQMEFAMPNTYREIIQSRHPELRVELED